MLQAIIYQVLALQIFVKDYTDARLLFEMWYIDNKQQKQQYRKIAMAHAARPAPLYSALSVTVASLPRDLGSDVLKLPSIKGRLADRPCSFSGARNSARLYSVEVLERGHLYVFGHRLLIPELTDVLLQLRPCVLYELGIGKDF